MGGKARSDLQAVLPYVLAKAAGLEAEVALHRIQVGDVVEIEQPKGGGSERRVPEQGRQLRPRPGRRPPLSRGFRLRR